MKTTINLLLRLYLIAIVLFHSGCMLTDDTAVQIFCIVTKMIYDINKRCFWNKDVTVVLLPRKCIYKHCQNISTCVTPTLSAAGKIYCFWRDYA